MKINPSRMYILIAGTFILLALVIFFISSRSNSVDNGDVVPIPPEVSVVMKQFGLETLGSQETTLRWVADLEDFVSVNLAARSYGLGFMKKATFDEFSNVLLQTVTREVANDASSTLAAQQGFRVGGRACIVGYTYTNSATEDESIDEGDREVYGIIVCSKG